MFSDNNYTDPNNAPFEISHMLYISWIWYFIDKFIDLNDSARQLEMIVKKHAEVLENFI